MVSSLAVLTPPYLPDRINLMKKVLLLIFALTLQASIAVPALAASSSFQPDSTDANNLPANNSQTQSAVNQSIQAAKACATQNKSNSGITVNCGSNAGDPNDADKSCPNGGVKVSDALGVSSNCVGGSTNPIFALLNKIITVFSAIFGLLLILGLVEAGIRYIISNGQPDDTKAAKERIKGVVTGLVLYVLMVGILNFLLPYDVKIFK
jgi:hypothetical protein